MLPGLHIEPYGTDTLVVVFSQPNSTLGISYYYGKVIGDNASDASCKTEVKAESSQCELRGLYPGRAYSVEARACLADSRGCGESIEGQSFTTPKGERTALSYCLFA